MKKFLVNASYLRRMALSVGLVVALPSLALAKDDFTYFSNHFIATRTMPIVNHIELLFTQNARYASLIKNKHSKQCYTLSVWPINHNIQYFTNEPVRESGNITPEHFVTLWAHQQTKAAPFMPNVEIQAAELNSATGHMLPFNEAASLDNVTYDAKHKIMRYTACPLAGSTIIEKQHLNYVTIFFDNFDRWPYQ